MVIRVLEMLSCSFCKMEFVRCEDLHQHVEACHVTGQTDGSSSDKDKSDEDLSHGSDGKDVDYKPDEGKVKVVKKRKLQQVIFKLNVLKCRNNRYEAF